MFKKASLTMIVLLLILTLASITVLAQSGPQKGKPTATMPPETPPVPTEIPDTGSLYGDLYVILRDVNGVPVMAEVEIPVPESEEGPAYVETVACIQPIATEDESVWEGATYIDIEIPFDIDGDGDGDEVSPDIITILPGEPFSPVSYVDAAGDLVECELSLYVDQNDPATPEDPTDDTKIYDLTPYVQSVDFGRLNLGRAPDAVINHAFDEAVTKFNKACDMTLDPAGRIMYALPDPEDETICVDWFTIDSPAENLALYIKMLTDGHWITLDRAATEHISGKGGGGGGGGGDKGPPAGDGPSTELRPILNSDARTLINLVNSEYANLVPTYTLDSNGNPVITDAPTVDDLGSEDFLLAASLLAGAGDKTGKYSIDKVIYINAIYGIANWSGADEEGYPEEFLIGGYQYGYGGTPGRSDVYDVRGSVECLSKFSIVAMWVLTTEDHLTFVADCVPLDPDNNDPVQFSFFEEVYTTYTPPETDDFDFTKNIRGFAKAADDALQVLEYIHNYRVPADLYAVEP